MDKAAAAVRKGIRPVTVWLERAGMVVLIFMIGMLTYSVIARKFFTPMKGAGEASEFAMVCITFLFVGANYLKFDAMCMDTYVEKLPRKARWIVACIVQVINVAILSLLSWQLFVQAGIQRSQGRHGATLEWLPVAPFVYIGAVGTAVLVVVYIVHLLDALAKTVEAWRA